MSSYTKILLVDDDKDDQLLFIDALSEVDPHVDCHVANNGLEAIDHLLKVPPPPLLIFLDLNMPYMSGFECLSILKNDNSYQDIPIVVFTTSNNADDCKRSLEMGAKMFLTKAPDFSRLKSDIQRVLDAHLR